MYGKEIKKYSQLCFKPKITMEHSINRHSLGNKKKLINT